VELLENNNTKKLQSYIPQPMAAFSIAKSCENATDDCTCHNSPQCSDETPGNLEMTCVAAPPNTALLISIPVLDML
jgi:hypothetical protein